MTYEPPEDPEKLIIQGNKAGRPPLPKYADFPDPVTRLFIQIRARMEKSKEPSPATVKAWLIQVRFLELMGYEIKVKEFENPTVQSVLEMFKTPEPEKKPEEVKPIVSAFPKDL